MKDYLELAKARIALMVVLTAAMGYYLGGGRDLAVLAWTILGTGLTSCSTGSLNQLLEKELDARMLRTRSRPLPGGRISPARALVFGLACGASGLGVLAWKAGALACGLAAFTMVSYLAAYTPLKRLSPQSTWVGAVSGAMPPLIGWAAARGALTWAGWALFAIQFIWQIPHFLAIFWLHREDYARAGFKVMPVVDPDGASTAYQIAIHSFALLPASLMPAVCGLAGWPYGVGALGLGTAFMGLGLRASWTLAPVDTRRLFFASLLYLPAIFGLLVLSAA